LLVSSYLELFDDGVPEAGLERGGKVIGRSRSPSKAGDTAVPEPSDDLLVCE